MPLILGTVPVPWKESSPRSTLINQEERLSAKGQARKTRRLGVFAFHSCGLKETQRAFASSCILRPAINHDKSTTETTTITTTTTSTRFNHHSDNLTMMNNTTTSNDVERPKEDVVESENETEQPPDMLSAAGLLVSTIVLLVAVVSKGKPSKGDAYWRYGITLSVVAMFFALVFLSGVMDDRSVFKNPKVHFPGNDLYSVSCKSKSTTRLIVIYLTNSFL